MKMISGQKVYLSISSLFQKKKYKQDGWGRIFVNNPFRFHSTEVSLQNSGKNKASLANLIPQKCVTSLGNPKTKKEFTWKLFAAFFCHPRMFHSFSNHSWKFHIL